MPVTVTFVPPTSTFAGHNSIIGTDAPESIVGTAITDIMIGGAGNDHLFGGDSIDALNGGPGADLLTGGPGSDVFFFWTAAEANGDWIADFKREDSDVISFSSIDNPSVAGDQALTWIGTASFTAEGQLRYEQVGAHTFIQGNTAGDLLPEFTIGVIGLVNFAPSDFFL